MYAADMLVSPCRHQRTVGNCAERRKFVVMCMYVCCVKFVVMCMYVCCVYVYMYAADMLVGPVGASALLEIAPEGCTFCCHIYIYIYIYVVYFSAGTCMPNINAYDIL
jgi:hypothetical protein